MKIDLNIAEVHVLGLGGWVLEVYSLALTGRSSMGLPDAFDVGNLVAFH